MTTDTTYNGWKNYETWNVALWLDNEQGSQRYWSEAAQECWDESDAPSANARLTGHEPFTREEKAVFALSDRLKTELEESAPDLGASMWSDLLSAALSEVDWREIAEHYIGEVNRGDDDSEDEDDE